MKHAVTHFVFRNTVYSWAVMSRKQSIKHNKHLTWHHKQYEQPKQQFIGACDGKSFLNLTH